MALYELQLSISINFAETIATEYLEGKQERDEIYYIPTETLRRMCKFTQ